MQLSLQSCPTRPRLWVLALLACLILPWLPTTTCHAQAGANSEWGPDLQKVEGFLRQHKWKQARRGAKSLANKIISRSWYSPDLAKILAELAFTQAVSDANLYNDREALWYWHIAGNLDPRMRRRDLSPYGEAGKLLKEFPLRSLGEMPAGFENIEVNPLVRWTPPVAPEIIPPRILSNSAAAREGSADLHVEVVVDKYGKIHHPVVQSDYVHPVVIYGTLQWLLKLDPFEPRIVEGKPTDCLFPLIVDFHVTRW